jgi:hypothetical protein
MALMTQANLDIGLASADLEIAGPSGPPDIILSGGWVRGSVALGDLNKDGIADIVVGGTDGKVYAYTGNGTRLWEYDTGDAPIEGKPAIGDINGDTWNEVVVGVGSTFAPWAPGRVWAFAHDNSWRWSYTSLHDFIPDGVPDGIYTSPALADLDGNDNGRLEIVYGGWDAYIRALNDDGTLLWELFTRDTIWSSPAVGDLDRDGKPEVVIGSDAHWEPAFGTIDGGKLYVLNGEDGSEVPGFFKQVDEVVWSSPALGDINGDGWLEIVVGTGDCYEHAACASGGRTHPVTDALYGWDHLGNPLAGWPIHLSEFAFASPALGDLDGNGDLEIIINTNDGYVHAFNADGSVVPGWPRLVTTPAGDRGQVVHVSTWASPVLADLTGDGYVEVILPSNWESVVWDRLGNQLTRQTCCPNNPTWAMDTEYTLSGTPAVGDVDGDGKMELIAAGARAGGGTGAIYVWDFDAPASGPAPWPRFRRDDMNHARYPIPPILAVNPASLFVMHQYGSGSSETRTLRITNMGDGQIDWLIQQPTPPRVSVTPLSGMAGSEQIVSLSIAVGDLVTGTHNLDYVTVTGTAGGQPVSGSPATIPITVYVGRVYKIFLPAILRNRN